MTQEIFKCPVCNGLGKINDKTLNNYKEMQKKVQEFETLSDRLTKKYNTDIREAVIKTKEEEAEKRRREADKQESIITERDKQIEKLKDQLKKIRQEKMTPQEQGKITVQRFVEMLHEEFPNDDIEAPENSRPDVVHIIKGNGKDIKFLYELKDKDTGYSSKDIEQTKRTATEFEATFKMLIVRNMPKRMNGTHIAFDENVVVSTIDSAVYLIAIFRKQYMENGASSIEDLQKFIEQRKEILDFINELGNTIKHRKNEHDNFYKDCVRFFMNNEQLMKIDAFNVGKLYELVNSVGMENEKPNLVESSDI